MSDFDPDYHETKEALPLIYNLGRLSLEWNMVEQFFTALVWELVGDYPTGMAVTGGMGNQSKADVILRISRNRVRNADTIDRIEFACKAFNILRENRNILIHSHSVFSPEVGEKPTWRRASGRDPTGHLSTKADFDDLDRIIAQICMLGIFATQLIPFLRSKRKRAWRGGGPPSLPEKFPLPELLHTPTEKPTTKGPTKRRAPSSKKAPR